jgi:tetratricopeptide (TPR) repeat protein
LKTRNHFEVLGIPRSSTEQHVKEAYFRLARRFHPDVHHDTTLSDLRDKLEAVFIRLGEAYEVLRNPRTRAAHEEALGRARPRTESPRPESPRSAAAAPPEEPPVDREAQKRAAEDSLRRAGYLYETEKYWDASQAVEGALELLDGKLQIRARVLLAKCYLKNPKWVKRAEEMFLAVVHDDPTNVEAYCMLGKVYQERGLKSRATTMFRKVLELKPDHEEARTAVSVLVPPEPEAPPSGGGLLGRLFKKG